MPPGRSWNRSLSILLALILLIVYASLYPWHFVARHFDGSPFWMLLRSWNGALNRRFISDVTVNILLYVPLGLSAWRAFAARMPRPLAVAGSLALGTVLSGSIEMLQLFTPGRDCSAFDLLDNVLGTGFGVTIGIGLGNFPNTRFAGWVFKKPVDRTALGLFLLWAASLLFPFFPVTSLIAFRTEIAEFVNTPVLNPIAFLSATMTWCAAGRLLTRAGVRSPGALLSVCLLIVPLQFAIVSRAPLPASVAGAAAGLILFGLLGQRRLRWQVFAAAFLGLLILRGLSPFHFTANNDFVWIPFGGSLGSGEWQPGVLILIEKISSYSIALWLLWDAGMQLRSAAFAVVTLLASIEALQTRLPGHVPEITDPLLAAMLGVLISVFNTTRARIR